MVISMQHKFKSLAYRTIFCTLVPVFRSTSLTLDSDFDGVSDIDENRLGTDPHNFDTDSSGLNDFVEIGYADPKFNSDPNVVDTDFDGLSDFEEYLYNTNPQKQNGQN